MNRNEVAVAVIDLINKIMVTKTDIQLEDRLKEDLNLDSMAFVELGIFLEENYNVDIPDESVEQLGTVSQVVDVVINGPKYQTE